MFARKTYSAVVNSPVERSANFGVAQIQFGDFFLGRSGPARILLFEIGNLSSHIAQFAVQEAFFLFEAVEP